MLKLTQQQAKALEMIREGKSQQDIADALSVSKLSAYGVCKRLRMRGAISEGVPGKAGSMKVLVTKEDYEVLPETPKIEERHRTPTIIAMARALHEEMSSPSWNQLELTSMPILADALVDAGADDSIVAFLRKKAPSRTDVDKVLPEIPMPTNLPPATSPDYWAAVSHVYERQRKRTKYEGKRRAWVRRVQHLLADILDISWAHLVYQFEHTVSLPNIAS